MGSLSQVPHILISKVDIHLYIDVEDFSHGASHALHFLENFEPPESILQAGTYLISLPIPLKVFNEDYPSNPRNFGERLRKARMDSGLQIKELAEMLGVTLETVINWELRGTQPRGREIRERIKKSMDVPVAFE